MVEPLVCHIIEHNSGRCKVEVPGDAVVQFAAFVSPFPCVLNW